MQKVQAKASSDEIEGHEMCKAFRKSQSGQPRHFKKLCRYSSMMQAIN